MVRGLQVYQAIALVCLLDCSRYEFGPVLGPLLAESFRFTPFLTVQDLTVCLFPFRLPCGLCF